MNKVLKFTFQNEFTNLIPHFTDEAWNILQGYLVSLQDTIDSTNISINATNSLLQGIYQYLLDFIVDNQIVTKIDFSQTLQLIDEIGSPKDIIKNIEISDENRPQIFPIDMDKGIWCDKCNWSNIPDSLFCQVCGNKLENYVKQTDLRQKIVDHPYSFSFLVVLSFLAVVSISLFRSGEGHLIIGLIPLTIFLTLIFGYAIRQIFGDELSFKARYNILLEDLEKNYLHSTLLLIPVLMIFQALVVAVFPSDLTSDFDGVSLPFIIFSSINMFALYAIRPLIVINEKKRPKLFPYAVLLKAKQIITSNYEIESKKTKKYLYLVSLIYSIALGSYIYFIIGKIIIFSVLVSLLNFNLVVIILHSIVRMYYNSWGYIKKHSLIST